MDIVNKDTSFNKFNRQAEVQIARSQNLFQKISKQNWGIIKNSWFFYFLPWVLLSLYAGKACPFIDENFVFDKLNNLLLQVSLVVFLTILPIYVIRCIIAYSIGREKIMKWSSTAYLLFEFSFFAIWVGVLFFIGKQIADILLESILKITVGPFELGLFSAFNMFLARQKYIYVECLKDNSLSTDKLKGLSFMSLRIKFILTSIFVLTLVGTAIALVSLKNFHWLLREYESIKYDELGGVASVFKEVVFIIAVFTGLLIMSIIAYTTNIKIIFVLLNNTIYNIFQKEFNKQSIPALNDEFGVMGENIKKIFSEMQEKDKIESALGKFVNPKVAEIILTSKDSKIERKGSLKEIVVFFSDIRKFTNITNNTAPEILIKMLNNYFTDVVSIIEKHEGLVDKFIGDALMVLFGYDQVTRGINNAVRAAYYIQKHLTAMSSPFKTGIGIATGNAVVGLMGSPNRLSFTAIGNTVNKAARLESATSTMNMDIIIDDIAYNALDSTTKQLPWKVLEVDAKGFDEKVKAFGLKCDFTQETQ